jgi:putative ABC transport system permease protein
MLRNYLKTAIRSLLRHRFFSAINVFGLSVAMSICMAIIMLVADQMSYDRYNTKSNRIFQVTTVGVDYHKDGQGQPNAASTMRLKQELLDNYTGVEKIVRIKRGFGNSWLEFENQNVNVPLAGFFADPEVFELFEYEFQYGDPSTALKEPYTVVLTRKAANKLFKEENPVGQTIKVGDLGTYTVTGVLKDTDKKSHIVFESLASMASVKSILNEKEYREEMDNWTNFWNGWTYILLEEGKSTKDIQSHLDKIFQQHIATIINPGVFKMKFDLQSLLEITPGPMMNNSIGPILPWLFVYFLGGLALVILLTSCFNFTNLSIARSLTRAREIGVRKVTGAMRWQIFAQFLIESLLVALVALILALGLTFLIKPMMLDLSFARIFRWDLQANYIVYGIFFTFAVVVGILAGLFPAVVLSGFQPVTVLKNLNNLKLFSKMGLRKVLLVSQFTLSLFFILTLIVIYNQLTLFVSQDHGFNMHNNILVRLNNTSHQELKTELSKYNNITSVSAASHVPAAGTSHGSGFKRKLDDPDWTEVGYFQVDENYLENMKVKLLAGSFFKEANGQSNKNFIVINQRAVRALHFNSEVDAINQEIILQHDSSRVTIIGVVKDYNHRDLFQAIGPMALMYDPERFSLLQVAYAGTYDNAVKTIEKAWSAVNPGLKADYKEVESEINQFYELFFGDVVKVIGFISVLAILISCLGLLGMATYATETRIKEISIRKVLGSSGTALVMLLSKGFLAMIAIAIALGVPAAYFANSLWLDRIAYHTTLDYTAISIGVLILILFAVLTVGSQTIRATFVNPVKNLKSE